MSRFRGKTSLPARLLGQAAAVFIMLSVSGECLQCYWCGPLAEQVHRRERAPRCADGAANVTCEPGYTHCAVVASSPPFVESRYCVKFYQDECYTLYCGTTKTHRTTCPCRGELCNGPSTRRELDAFAPLAGAHDNRITKRDATPDRFDKHNLNVIDNPHDHATTFVDNDPKEAAAHDRIHKRDTIPARFNHKHTLNLIDDPQDEAVNLIDAESIKESNTSMPTEQTAASENQQANDDLNISQTPSEVTNEADNPPEIQTDATNDNGPTTHLAPVETTKIVTVAEAHEEMESDNEIDTTPKITEEKHTDAVTTHRTEATTQPTEAMNDDPNAYASNEIKPSLELPTAEALQQSGNTVTEKHMEPTTMTETESTTRMTTILIPKSMTPTMKSNKNSSNMLYSCISVLLICITMNLSL